MADPLTHNERHLLEGALRQHLVRYVNHLSGHIALSIGQHRTMLTIVERLVDVAESMTSNDERDLIVRNLGGGNFTVDLFLPIGNVAQLYIKVPKRPGVQALTANDHCGVLLELTPTVPIVKLHT